MTHTVKHYSGTDLVRFETVTRDHFAELFPGATPAWLDGYGSAGCVVGRLRGGEYRLIERTVRYKSRAPKLHACDARCVNAKGAQMMCECACGGKMHGIGALVCR